jgi:hypothetical protein
LKDSSSSLRSLKRLPFTYEKIQEISERNYLDGLKESNKRSFEFYLKILIERKNDSVM